MSIRFSPQRRIAFAISILYAFPLLGHDTWLMPDRSRVTPGDRVTFDLTSGMGFPALDVAVKPDRLDRTGLRIAGKTEALSTTQPGEKSLRLTVALPQSGVATIWVASKPRQLELQPKQVVEYFEEVGADEAIRREWEASERKPLRERYRKHAKTFVRVGEPSADRSWSEPAGMTLEIIPERDPTGISVGEEVSFQVLRDGRSVAGFPISSVAAGEKRATTRKTDSDGRVSFQFPRKGWWMLKGTQLRRAADADAEWESHFTTLTFEIQSKP